jgi:hypothetical protein
MMCNIYVTVGNIMHLSVKLTVYNTSQMVYNRTIKTTKESI